MPRTETASAARIYDYFLGGHHHRAVDREVAETIRHRVPRIGDYCRSSRQFLGRAVRRCVELGATQFVDVGSGLPSTGTVHDVVDALLPDRRGRVVYVDNDPGVQGEAAAVLSRDADRHAVVLADALDPDALWDAVRRTGRIDLGRPVALVTNALWHFVPDSAEPAAALARHRAHLPAGSLLVLSQMTGQDPVDDREAGELDALVDFYAAQGIATRLRDADSIRTLLHGWELLDPGLVYVAGWRPDADTPFAADPSACRVLGALARASGPESPASAMS